MQILTVPLLTTDCKFRIEPLTLLEQRLSCFTYKGDEQNGSSNGSSGDNNRAAETEIEDYDRR